MDFPDPLTVRPSTSAPTPPSVRAAVPLDFPDATEQRVPKKKSDVDRMLELMHVQHTQQMEVLRRAEHNQTHLLAVASGWLVCLGIMATLVFSGGVMALGAQLWRDSRSSDWSDVKGQIGRFLVAWAVLLLVILIPPMFLRRTGFRLFKLKA
jgi:hypothetical protein